MEIKKINEILSHIGEMVYDYGSNPYKKVIDICDNKVDKYIGSRGEYNTITRVFDLNSDNLFLKIELQTDSYGNNELISSIQFVKPIVKQVTDFEII